MKNESAIIGTFTGKCCDSTVANSNGMFLSSDLFNTLINSDEYKTAIKNGYYIGYLGHPEDPNDMNFKNACIVMTDMRLEPDGSVTGEFNLVDTPVGQVVKSFIDAGVKFGISIRGAGDVASDGTVDPDTFVFRGFDIVTFPAYEDCVPKFQEIAASQDVETVKKYKKVCNTVKKNLSSITSCDALDVIKNQFNPNSDEYSDVQDRIDYLSNESDKALYNDVLQQKVGGLTRAYIETVTENCELRAELERLRSKIECSDRSTRRARQINANQKIVVEGRLSKALDDIDSLRIKVQSSSSEIKKLRNQIAASKKSESEAVKASKTLESKLNNLQQVNKNLESENLKFKQKISSSIASNKGSENRIQSLTAKLRETVTSNESLKKDVSNLESKNRSLQSEVEASKDLIFEYQQAYADNCAYAAGVSLDNIPVTASTSVDELRSYIYSQASKSRYSSIMATSRVPGYDDTDVQDDTGDGQVDEPVIM